MNVLFYTPKAFAISESFIYRQLLTNEAGINQYVVCNDVSNQDVYRIDPEMVVKVSPKPVGFFDRIASRIWRMYLGKNEYVIPLSTYYKLLLLIRERRINIIHAQYGPSAMALLPLIKKTGLPLITHFHGYDASTLLNDLEYLNHLPEVLALSKGIVVVSSDMKDRLRKHGLDENKTFLIPYGIDLNKFIEEPSRDLYSFPLNLLHAGRLTEKKGVPDLIRVFGNLKLKENLNIRLTIIGDGSDLTLCKTVVNELNLQMFVDFKGALPNNEVVKEMYKCDVFILNSRTASNGDKEGFPNAILEAMAAGMAVISTYHAGIPNAIDHEFNGMLVPENNNQALESALMKVIKNSECRHFLQVNAREKAINEFSKERMLKGISDMYYSLVQ